MITADYHTHTAYSTDSDSPVEEMIKRAIALGLKHYCITDHMDYLFPEEGQFEFDVEAYFKELRALQTTYRPQIDLRIGIELGLRNEPDVRDAVNARIQALLQKYPFDFVIGSVHVIEHLDPYESVYWERYSVSDGVRLYLESLLYGIRNYSGFQACGHLDYILRYVPKGHMVDMSQFQDLTDEILRELIVRNIALEVNTSILARGGTEPNPSLAILSRYRELGGSLITLGSDAHVPERIATHFTEVRKLLLSLGFTHYAIYRKQNKSLRRL